MYQVLRMRYYYCYYSVKMCYMQWGKKITLFYFCNDFFLYIFYIEIIVGRHIL